MATAPPRPPDAVLVRRLQQRDRTAWDELYTAYGRRLHAFAYRLAGNEHDAADLVQETFVRALPRLDELDPERVEIGPYLFATLRNLFLKEVERRGRQQPVEEVPEPDVPAPIEDDPERSLLLARQQEEVRAANARLAPRQRLVLALCELEDRSYAEIGELVGLNENAVAQLVFRARESLRVELRLAQVDPDRLPPECREFLPQLAAHLDGKLKGAKLEETLAHLQGCERCQDALESMREAKRRYRTLLPLATGLEELGRRTDDALAANGYWSTPRSGVAARAPRRGPRRVAVGIAAAAGALALGGAGVATILVDRGPQRGAAATAPAPARPQETASPAPPPPAPPPSPPAAAAAPPDSSPPVVRITAAPSGRMDASSAVFVFTAGEPRARFRCRLDTRPARPCRSPARYTGLPSGAHVFAVRATDPAGNTGRWATRAWTVVRPAAPATTAESAPATTAPAKAAEPAPPAPAPPPAPTPPPAPAAPKPKPKPKPTPKPPAPPPATAAPADETAPTVTITGGPSGLTGSADAAFAFRASEPGATFACSIDGGPFQPCTSPSSYAALAPGAHTFAVRATDRAGNTGPPATAAWTFEPPDTTPPTVSITGGPSGTTTATAATFAFTADEAGATFACSLDGAPHAPCTSPVAYATLAVGPHTFAVRATDAAGNTGADATRAWEVVAPLPDLVVSLLTKTSVVVTNVGSVAAGPSLLSVTLIGTFSLPALLPGQSVTRTWSVCRAGTLTAVADRGHTVAESSERNNTASLTTSCR